VVRKVHSTIALRFEDRRSRRESKLRGAGGVLTISNFQMPRRKMAWKRTSHAHMRRVEHTRSNLRGDNKLW